MGPEFFLGYIKGYTRGAALRVQTRGPCNDPKSLGFFFFGGFGEVLGSFGGGTGGMIGFRAGFRV